MGYPRIAHVPGGSIELDSRRRIQLQIRVVLVPLRSETARGRGLPREMIERARAILAGVAPQAARDAELQVELDAALAEVERLAATKEVVDPAE